MRPTVKTLIHVETNYGHLEMLSQSLGMSQTTLETFSDTVLQSMRDDVSMRITKSCTYSARFFLVKMAHSRKV